MLVVSNIVKKYKIDKDYETILKGINFSFKPGFNVILGKSGCGKTTLLNIIGGLDSDYEGNVVYEGIDLKDFSSDIYRKSEIAFIFQNILLLLFITKRMSVYRPLPCIILNN